MAHICLLALIGLPAAGKTHLSNWLLKQKLNNWNVLHLCYDHYLDNNTDYKAQRYNILNLLSQLIDALRMSSPQLVLPMTTNESSNYLIVCDDNHYYHSMRYKLYQLCRSRGCLYAQLYLATPLSTCLQRNAAREQQHQVPAAIIEQMHKRLEVPNNQNWQRHQLTIQELNNVVICAFVDTLLNCQVDDALPPTPAIKQSQQLQTQSHQLDLRLRMRIQSLMRQHTTEKAARSCELNAQRRQLLAQFKAHEKLQPQPQPLDYYVNLLN
ncbi:L-seryl-tRNA(Sec) kinase [Drosophila nasuta]|uniref:L-seryl-tRNA(Sec) kinase n=1 Tax=Drosophila nasuta TaxID=42062 RepID=UPI00295EFDFA|nr:L-seryl-tRNA(Sec) kinase [Drosophila nasuta]